MIKINQRYLNCRYVPQWKLFFVNIMCYKSMLIDLRFPRFESVKCGFVLWYCQVPAMWFYHLDVPCSSFLRENELTISPHYRNIFKLIHVTYWILNFISHCYYYKYASKHRVSLPLNLYILIKKSSLLER